MQKLNVVLAHHNLRLHYPFNFTYTRKAVPTPAVMGPPKLESRQSMLKRMNKALKKRERERRERAQEAVMEGMRARIEAQELRIEEMGR